MDKPLGDYAGGAGGWYPPKPEPEAPAPKGATLRDTPTPYEDMVVKRMGFFLFGLVLGVGLTLLAQALTG